ncbi:DUF1932 domain-containing protein [Sphingomonas canadensis]|uniref:DUF1932 domain-containing protein n=1 Tax=Sphingomonas canadensis TaxID=1219257 RepID=A0ABW3H3U3_9SPHN
MAIAFIGFGEAGQAFSGGAPARGYDHKTDVPALREAKLAEFAAAGVQACGSAAEALAGAGAVICVVTADQALEAARSCAPLLAPGALWFDMNSVAPETKRAAAAAIDAAGGCYVDTAVLSPVNPRRLAAPLLLSGPHAAAGEAALKAAGFTGTRVVEGPVGAASAIKMVRSVMVKGMEALAAECAIAAARAGVTDAVMGSLGGSFPGIDWPARTDYCLDRMMVHGLRRAAEMEEVVKTLEALGVEPVMTRGTVMWQRAIGERGLAPEPGLAAKVAAIDSNDKEQAA